MNVYIPQDCVSLHIVKTWFPVLCFILKDVEQHAGLSGPHANDIVGMVNKMLAIEWLSDVSQCLAETLEAGKNRFTKNNQPILFLFANAN